MRIGLSVAWKVTAPARDPKLLVAVMVDEPHGDIYGGSVAAPAWKKITSFALSYLKIAP